MGQFCRREFSACQNLAYDLQVEENIFCMVEVHIFVVCLSSILNSMKFIFLDIDECDPNPCNNGECIDLVNDFTCVCDDGYEGEVCDGSMYISDQSDLSFLL